MLERALLRAGLIVTPLCLLACSATGDSTTPSATASASSVANGGIDDPGFFRSKRFGLLLPLPEGKAWKIDDTTSHWLVASRPEESSTLLVRRWRAEENRMNRDKCEALARSVRKLPNREGAEIVDTLRVDNPPGFDTQIDVALMPDNKGGLFGFVLAFGGYRRGCFAYIFATRAEGPSADRVVGNRLALMVEGSLKVLKVVSDLELAPGQEPLND